MTAYEGTHEEIKKEIERNKGNCKDSHDGKQKNNYECEQESNHDGNHGSNHEDIQTLIKEAAISVESKVVEWRRYLHAHPELSGEEENTSLYIKQTLDTLGIPYNDQVFGHAVVACIDSGKPGKTVALRADMDALPVKEQTGAEFASHHDGVMHACGHDSHMAIALGAAAVLNKVKNFLQGRVYIVFQPAEEEALINGAKNIMASGVLDEVDEIFGLHVWPGLPVGTVGVRDGAMMAASDHFYVTITGKSTHGAEPHNGIDAIVAAANWITGIESIVARETDPMESIVVTVGTINGGDRYNVGCGEVTLEGTCRTFAPAKRDYIETRLAESLQALDMLFHTTSELTYKRGHGATVNHAASAQRLRKVAASYGITAVTPEHPSMCAEDFSSYIAEKPGAFFWLGTGYEGCPALHNASFIIDETILKTGVTLMCGAAADVLLETKSAD